MDEGEFWSRSDWTLVYIGRVATYLGRCHQRSTWEWPRGLQRWTELIYQCLDVRKRERERERKEVRLKTDATRDLYAADEGLKISLLGMSPTNSSRRKVQLSRTFRTSIRTNTDHHRPSGAEQTTKWPCSRPAVPALNRRRWIDHRLRREDELAMGTGIWYITEPLGVSFCLLDVLYILYY